MLLAQAHLQSVHPRMLQGLPCTMCHCAPGMTPDLLLAQVYLQEFAWTEETKAAAVARRADHAVHAAERSLLTAEPMFCFQTAVALHRWSCLTYMREWGLDHACCRRLRSTTKPGCL